MRSLRPILTSDPHLTKSIIVSQAVCLRVSSLGFDQGHGPAVRVLDLVLVSDDEFHVEGVRCLQQSGLVTEVSRLLHEHGGYHRLASRFISALLQLLA